VVCGRPSAAATKIAKICAAALANFSFGFKNILIKLSSKMMCAIPPENWQEPRPAIDSTAQTQLPLVTIVTVVYNAAQDLAKTIESVKQQTYQWIEYIVVDGNSTDGTAEVVQQYGNWISKSVREPDRGAYDAMNKGIALAEGQIIGLLNAGDCYRPGAIAAVVAAYQQNLLLGGGDYLLIAAGLEVITHSGLHYLKQPNILAMDRDLSLPHPSLFVTKKVFERFGGFAAHYAIAADYDFVLRTYRHCQVLLLPEVTTVMAPLGLSQDFWLTASEAHRARLVNGVPPPVSYFHLWVKRLRILLHWTLEVFGLWTFFEGLGKHKV
jgi:glycosyltransferase involved in cell wall biosynthesis